MALITIKDLSADRTLDRSAMATLRGGAAPWVYGWIQPFAPATPSFAPSVNYYQFNHTVYAGQLIDQSQNITINNSGNNSSITTVMVSSLAA